MKCIKHQAKSDTHGFLHVQTGPTVTFKIHVWKAPNGSLHFSFRHPDSNVTRQAQSVLDRLSTIVPFDVYDLAIVR